MGGRRRYEGGRRRPTMRAGLARASPIQRRLSSATPSAPRSSRKTAEGFAARRRRVAREGAETRRRFVREKASALRWRRARRLWRAFRIHARRGRLCRRLKRDGLRREGQDERKERLGRRGERPAMEDAAKPAAVIAVRDSRPTIDFSRARGRADDAERSAPSAVGRSDGHACERHLQQQKAGDDSRPNARKRTLSLDDWIHRRLWVPSNTLGRAGLAVKKAPLRRRCGETTRGDVSS